MYCRRLQELEEETNALKRQLLSTSPTVPSDPLPSGDIPPTHQEEDINVLQIPMATIARRNEVAADNDPTLSRNINGLELPSFIIDDCFKL